MGSEISQYLRRIGAKSPPNRIEIEDPTEDDVQMLDSMWKEYEKNVVWRGERFEEEHQDDLVPLTTLEKIHRWEDFACDQLGGVQLKCADGS